MSEEKSIEERYQFGLPIVAAFFKLSDAEIIDKLKSICGRQLKSLKGYDILEEGASNVTRMIKSEKPSDITISYYGNIKIHPFGITYNPEHGEGKTLIEFNEHFKL